MRSPVRHPIISLTLAMACAGAGSLPAYAGKEAGTATQTTTQLPRNVRPLHYDLMIVPDAGALRFTAKAGITIEVIQPTSSITLNALDLAFNSVHLTSDQKSWNATTTEINESQQTATFGFDHQLARGRYRLVLDYTGKIGTRIGAPVAQEGDDLGFKICHISTFQIVTVKRPEILDYL